MLGISQHELKSLLLSVGTHRLKRRLSPMEVAQLIKKAKDSGVSIKQCAEALLIGTTQVSRYLNLLNLTPEIQHLADWGSQNKSTVPFSTLSQVAKLPTEDQVNLTNKILDYNLTFDEVVQLVQIHKRSGKSVDDCIKSVLDLRPVVVKRYLYIGTILSKDLGIYLGNISQLQRDELFNQALESLIDSVDIVNGRLSKNNFTLVSSYSILDLLSMDADELELKINQLILDYSNYNAIS